MEPRNIGRTLGIGLRVAGRVAGKRVAENAQRAAVATDVSTVQSVPETTPKARAAGSAAGQNDVRASGSVGKGVAGFLRPFRRVGGTVMLEVTGVFFLLFVVVFAPTLWRTRMSWAQGPDHRTFLASAVIVVVFLYLSASAFWRARKR
jgi:hypothetical protein